MTLLLSLFACAPSDYFSTSALTDEGVSVELTRPSPALLAAEGLADGSREAASYGPAGIEVQLPPGTTDGFIELRAYRADGDDIEWIGRPLVMHEVEGPRERVRLPTSAPRRDRVSAAEPVLYAISFRAPDAAGNPGLYRGISPARLVHVRTEAPDGAILGWNLAAGADGEDPAWSDLDTMVRIDQNLLGDHSAAVGGSALSVTDNTRIVAAVSSDPGEVPMLDVAARTDWSVVVDGSPDSSFLEMTSLSDDLPMAAEVSLFTYEDEDGDLRRGDAPVTAAACAGGDPVFLSWIAPANRLDEALSLARVGGHGGWEILADTDAGAVPLTEAQRANLRFAESCE